MSRRTAYPRCQLDSTRRNLASPHGLSLAHWDPEPNRPLSSVRRRRGSGRGGASKLGLPLSPLVPRGERGRLMESLHDFLIAHWDHEPRSAALVTGHWSLAIEDWVL